MVDFQNDIEKCLKVLTEGGIILYPTDTIWGIGCDATNSKAVEKIYALKQRPDQKAMIILLADKKDLLHYTANPDPSIFDYLSKIKKPTTIIYNDAIGLADNLISSDGSIAIRITDDLFCKTLIKRFRKPIVSTSANISGQPGAPFFRNIDDAIKVRVDYAVQYRQDDHTVKQPSSIVRITKDGGIVIIRE